MSLLQGLESGVGIEDHLGSFRVECRRVEMQGCIYTFSPCPPQPSNPGQDGEDLVPSFLLPWLPCRSLVIHSSPLPTGPQLKSCPVPTLTALLAQVS